LATILVAACAPAAPPPDVIARGRYLVMIGGCNDCHTPGYGEKAGDVPEAEWLSGAGVGFRGPWGTTYPANLRLLAQRLSEDEWVPYLRVPRRPPMPWFNTVKMSDEDLRAMYRFIHSLGPAGEAAPDYVAPDGQVTTPYIDFVPKTG
jgi:mono/diheme cytochrome c family protein